MKTVDEYLKLPYKIVLTADHDDDLNFGYLAEVPDLPGCMSQGATQAEAAQNIESAMRDWLEVAIEKGVEIPEPKDTDSYSGRFLVRIPTSLHARLAELAEREGVSLNQFVVGTLAGATGWGRPREYA